MNQVTKKQHYIWRNYLRPWTDNNSTTGRITCLRKNKIFSTSLMNIAHENYFYNIHALSDLERKCIYKMVIEHTSGAQREMCMGWLNLCCAPFDLENELWYLFRSVGTQYGDRIEEKQKLEKWKIEYIEKLHDQIELMGIQYLENLKQRDMAFWDSEEHRDRFSFFICNQYFRTKRTREVVISAFQMTKSKFPNGDFANIHPENIWIPLSLILASNLGAHITLDFSAVLLQAKESSFIVGDQPVINTYSTFDMSTQPKDMELFYPITPHLALLLTKNPQYTNGSTVELNTQEIARYNRLEFMLSWEQTFAKDRTQLEPFLD